MPPQSQSHGQSREPSRVQSVMHAFPAKWIDHAGRVPNAYEIRRSSAVGHRPGDAAVWPIDVAMERLFTNKETCVRPVLFDTHRAAVTILKKPEIQHVPARRRLATL